MTRIFLIDDHPFMRESLREFLERQPDLVVCGEAPSAALALERLPAAAPDLVLIDVSLPDMSGIALARILRARYPSLTLAMHSGHRDKSRVDQALEAGVNGYIVKGRWEELLDALYRMRQGGQYLSAGLDSGG